MGKIRKLNKKNFLRNLKKVKIIRKNEINKKF